MKMVKDDFLELLVDLFLLAQYNVSFSLDSLRFELRVLEDVG